MHEYVLLVSDGEFNLDPLIMQQFSDMTDRRPLLHTMAIVRHILHIFHSYECDTTYVSALLHDIFRTRVALVMLPFLCTS